MAADDIICWICGENLGRELDCLGCGAINGDWGCSTFECNAVNEKETWPICPTCGMHAEDGTFDHELAIQTIARHLRTWGYEEGWDVLIWVPEEQDELEDNRILFVYSQIVALPGENPCPVESWSYAGPGYVIDQEDEQLEPVPPDATRFRVNAQGELIVVPPSESKAE